MVQKQQRNYNKGARDLPSLVEDDEVWMQPLRLGDKEFKHAIALREAGIHSYEVEDERAQTYIRNGKQLKKAGEHTNSTEDNMPAMLLIPSDPYPEVTPGPASDTADTPGTATPPPNQPPGSP